MTADGRPRRSGPGKAAFAAAVAAVVALQLILFLRHSMWRDELQAWMIAAASATPFDLYRAMRNEGHPGLWHALLWLASSVWNDPAAMRALQLAISLGLVGLIVRHAPFSRLEKILVCVGYYLLFEYTVIARAYGLGMLLLLFAVHRRAAEPARPWTPWLCLGLAANTSVFGALMSIAFATVFLWEARGDWRRTLPALAAFGLLLALAAVWMMPAADTAFGPPPAWHVTPDTLIAVLRKFVRALVPAGPTAPWGWDPDVFALAGVRFAESRTVAVAAAIGVSVLALAALGDQASRAGFALAALLILGFLHVYGNIGAARHIGAIYVAFLGFLWFARMRSGGALVRRPAPALSAAVLLAAGAAGGLGAAQTALSRPFSRGADVASFLRATYPADVFVIGAVDFASSAVAGALSRPIYYPACDCLGTFIRWNTQRRGMSDVAPESPLWPRIAARLAAVPSRTAVLLAGRPVAPDEVQRAHPDLAIVARGEFLGAIVPAEQFYVYEVTFGGARPRS